MRILRMAFVGEFAGALMAGNVGTLYAAPLPTNVATIKSMVADSSTRVRWGGADRLTATITPDTVTIRHTLALITALGKQSRNPGPSASDPPDPGAIGKRGDVAAFG
jgi:hypothetical protein